MTETVGCQPIVDNGHDIYLPFIQRNGSGSTTIRPIPIESQQTAVLHGLVCAVDGTPQTGVHITIHQHPEYGQTNSQSDGTFTLPVDGGQWLTVNYQLDGHLPLQRQIHPTNSDHAWLPDVTLLPLDAQVTTIDLTQSQMQVAQGSVVTDDAGTRQNTLFFASGTTAVLHLPNGTTQPLTELNVRATEYSVGDEGPQAMPGELPAGSAYTYAVELSVDEALAVNVTRVQFNQPVINYVDNFLNFPVGGIVPAGYYDRQAAAWVASENGRVVGIISISNGRANVDTSGDGTADNSGLSLAERDQLAALYTSGDTLWRVPVTHFTPWDYNWPPYPECDPNAESCEPGTPPQPPEDGDPKPCKQSGSIIECQNQVLGEQIPLVGTPFTLNYRSNRVPGYAVNRRLTIPVSGQSVPDGLQRIELTIFIAGRRLEQTFPPKPNQITTFTWDGLDVDGRSVLGEQTITVRIGYVYNGNYGFPPEIGRAFARFGNGLPILQAHTARGEFLLFQEYQAQLLVWDGRSQALGGWSLDVHHAYNPVSQNLYLGNGDTRRASELPRVINTVAGDGLGWYGGDGGPATAAHLWVPHGVVADSAGNLYIADTQNNRIRKVDNEGIITTIAGTGTGGYNGDNIPATAAQLSYPTKLDIGPDGSLYIADFSNGRIRKITPDGIITTVAGNGSYDFSGDEGPATQAAFRGPQDVAVAPDGSFYVADFSNHRIRKVGTDGIITTVVDSVTVEHAVNPYAVAVDGRGNLYFSAGPFASGQFVRRLGTDGRIQTIAGGGIIVGDGGPATEAAIKALGLTIDPQGNLYIADAQTNRARIVYPDGTIDTLAGSGTPTSPPGDSGDGGPATRAQLNTPYDVAIDGTGLLYLADSSNSRIRQVRAPFPPQTGQIVIAKADGTQLFVFDEAGQQQTTLDALTGAVLYTFTYDGAGRLTAVTDSNNNITTIQRNGQGDPTAIVAPFGQVTALTQNSDGYLTSVTNPAGESYSLSYLDEGGLLTAVTNPRGFSSTMSYDADGRLLHDENAAGGYWALDRLDSTGSYSVTLTSAEGRSTVYVVDDGAAAGQQRTNFFASGTQTGQFLGRDGTTLTQLAAGTTISLLENGDPRWGLQAPLAASRTISTPNGLVQQVDFTRAVSLTDATNLLSLAVMTDSVTMNGRPQTSLYTAANRTFTTTLPTGRQQIQQVDAQGRLIGHQNGDLLAVSLSYDANGRLATTSQGDRTTTLSYNGAGYLAAITDAVQRTVTFVYDEAGRVTGQTLPDGRLLQYSYDANGNLTSLTPPGRPAHTFSYTAVDLMATYTAPDVGNGPAITSYSYNLDQQLTSITRPDAEVIAFEYDAAGRIAAVDWTNGGIVYGYEPTTGNLAVLTTAAGNSVSFSYDGALPLTAVWSGTVVGSVERGYDNDFHIASLRVNGSTAIAYSYDDDSLLTQVGNLALTRQPQSGLLAGSTLGNVSDAWAYNGYAEPISYTAVWNGTPLYDVQFGRDDLGRIITKTETVTGSPSTTVYGYDMAGRLAMVTVGGETAVYSYDDNGNRLTYTSSGGTTNGSYDAQDRLLQYGTATFTYTANGDLLSKTEGGQVTGYNYDPLGNLTAVSLPDGTQITYVVDGRNRRLGKRVDGVLIQGFLYQDQLNPIAELDGNNQIVSRFVYGSRTHVPDYVIKGGITYRILTDHLGSPRLVVNSSTGAIAQRLDYDEFGKVLLDTNPGFQPFGFAGGLYDADTGLTRFGARDYAGEYGRWTAKDPILSEGRLPNLYAYVDNEPVNRWDNTGFIPKMGLNDIAKGYQTADEIVDTAQDIAESLVDLDETQNKLNDPNKGLGEQGAEVLDALLNLCGRFSGTFSHTAEAGRALLKQGIENMKQHFERTDNEICKQSGGGGGGGGGCKK